MILVIQSKLLHYRLELLNALATLDDVVIVHSGAPARRETDRFEEVLLPARTVGPFHLQEGVLALIEKRRPDAVIAMFDLRWVNTIRAMYRFDRRLAWIWWGLDQGKCDLATRAKLFLARRPNPIVFYNEMTRAAFAADLRNKDRLFVANNTFHVSDRIESYRHPVKTRFINVGSLDARKQNDVTIRVLKQICDETGAEICYSLIGDGAERDRLKALAKELGMEDRVELLGEITDPAELTRYYAEAIASVSFGQAGLAVLQSMAFGVPFVTKRNAISGGEKNNIRDGVNGMFCDDDPADLERVLRQLLADPDGARNLGRAAYGHYSQLATLENVIKNFHEAIALGRASL